ncbi:MAG: DUF3810 domain-containing protein [bacterium]|nr:DUF3810 domain-containing protein [bacterium]
MNTAEHRPKGAPTSGPGDRPVHWPLALLCFGLLPLGGGLFALAHRYPSEVDHGYSRLIFPPLRRGLSAVSGLLPFSLAELILGIAFTVLVVRVGRGLRKLRRGQRSARNLTAHAGAQTLTALGLVYAAFLILWGFNYARQPLAESLRLERAPASADDLARLVAGLVDRMNELRTSIVPEDCALAGSRDPRLALAFGALSRESSVFDARLPRVRRPLLSPLLSRLGVTGIYSPFTGEPHVDADIPVVSVPFVACHELAHALGFAREDEANFIGFLACRAGGDAAFEYSGCRAAYLHAIRRLLRADRGRAVELAARRSDAVRADSEEAARFWRAREGVLTEVGRKSNDVYLKSQGESEGVRSYGRMVDLLIADHRLRSGR